MAGKNITLVSEVGRELLPTEADDNIKELDNRSLPGWKDMIGVILPMGSPVPPTLAAFGPSGLRREAKFAVDDYAFVSAFHVNHDIKVGGKAYVHVHWSTSGTDTNSVKWEFQIQRALGHDQSFFGAADSYYVETQPNQVQSGAWRHYVSEVSDNDALTLTEPDELIMVTIKRITNGATDNADDVFGLTVDFHYESDKDSTVSKSPDFYVAGH